MEKGGKTGEWVWGREGDILGTEGGHELLSTQDKQRSSSSVAIQDRKSRRPRVQTLRSAAETGGHLGFSCKKWEELRKEVWIEEEATVRKWRDWEDLDSGNWVIKAKDAEGKLVVRDRVYVEDQATSLVNCHGLTLFVLFVLYNSVIICFI